MKLKYIIYLFVGLLLFNGCEESSNDSQNNGNDDPPVLKTIKVTAVTYNAMTIAAPELTNESGLADSITGYIGLASTITRDGRTVSNATESGIDLSSAGYTFNNLATESEYKIIVIAENSDGYAIQERLVTTGSVPLVTPLIFCNYESKYIHQNAVITFDNEHPTGTLYIGSSTDTDSEVGDITNWQEATSFTFSILGTIKIFAKVVDGGSTIEPVFSFTYEVVENYPNYSDEGIRLTFDGETINEVYDMSAGAVISISAWADGYISPVSYGLDVDESWKTPDKALGQATGNNIDIVCLGNHGSIILTFSSGISDGDGYDFVVFENAFESGTSGSGDMFAELGYIEVSSDGINFVQFDTVSRTDAPVGVYGTINLGDVYGLAGMHPNSYGESYGTPFDLNWLKNKRKVLEGIVDLNNIKYVRITDISGVNNEDDSPDYYPVYDSFGNTIIDAYKTFGSGGFDLEAVGVINSAE